MNDDRDMLRSIMFLLMDSKYRLPGDEPTCDAAKVVQSRCHRCGAAMWEMEEVMVSVQGHSCGPCLLQAEADIRQNNHNTK